MIWLLFIGVCGLVQVGTLLLLKRVQAYQSIYNLSPESHQKKKSTPSFGGVGLLLSFGLGCLLFQLDSKPVVWLLLVCFFFGLIGFIDDLRAVMSRKNLGFRATQKFLLQSLGSVGLLALFHGWIRPLSVVEVLFFLFLLVGTSNATNLSDGLDGLLGGLSLITLVGFSVLVYSLGGGELFYLCCVMGLSVCGFLVLNWHPAKIFMGDTGSLALGAFFAGLAIVIGNPWVLLSFGAVFVIETLSVVMQVGRYKLSKKRVFLMAPLHHHFELLGLHERRVVGLFWCVSACFVGFYFL